MQCQELSELQLLEVFCRLLSLCEDYDLFVPIRFNVALDMFEHLLLTLVQYCLVFDAFRHLIGVVSYQINQDRVLKLIFCEFLNESRDSCRENHAIHFILFEVLLDLNDVLLKTHV